MDKKFPLSIILQTVDNATAGIQRVTEKVKALGIAQLRVKAGSFGDAFEKLGKASGADKVLGSFKRVGSEVQSLTNKVLGLGVAAVGIGIASAAGLKGIVDQFDNLGDTADKIGIAASELAALRLGAQLAGASFEDIDAGLLSFSANLGALRANTGRLHGFLEIISPALERQLKRAKTSGDALDILANAMSKLKDPAKQAKLALAAGFGPNLVPFLKGGAKGMQDFRDQFKGAAGDIDPAVKVAGDLDNSFHILNATFDGIKANIITGVGPALLKLVEQLTKFLAENRGNIEKWAKQIGDALPGAIDSAIKGFNKVIDIGGSVIDKVGGMSNAVSILAGLLVGRLVFAIGAASVALLTTPFGWVVISLAAVTAAVTALAVAMDVGWDDIASSWAEIWRDISGAVGQAWKEISEFVDKIMKAVKDVDDFIGGKAIMKFITGGNWDDAGKRLEGDSWSKDFKAIGDFFGGSLPGTSQQPTKIEVEFKNTPPGTRVRTDPGGPANVDIGLGYSPWTLP